MKKGARDQGVHIRGCDVKFRGLIALQNDGPACQAMHLSGRGVVKIIH